MANHLSLLIDIGNEATKLVYVKHLKDEIAILDFDIFDTPHDLFSEDEALVNTSPEFSKRISHSMKKMNVKTKHVFLSIANAGIITRETTLPVVDDKQLKGMIEMEIPQHFLIDLKEFVIDYKIAEKRADHAGTMQYVIFLVAAPLRIVDSYLMLMNSCDLLVSKIDFYGNSIAKLIGNEYLEESGETIAVLDMGNVKTTISICRGKALRYSRSVLFGRSEFDALARETEQCAQSEVPAIYQSFDMMHCSREYEGVPTLLEERFSKLAGSFVSEVSRVLEFYISRERDNRIDKIIVIGGFSSMKNLDEYLTKEFGTPTEQVCPFRKFKVERRSDDFQKMRILFSNCLGAAL